LNRNTFLFGLYHDAFHPIPHAAPLAVVVAKHLDAISDLVLFLGNLPVD